MVADNFGRLLLKSSLAEKIIGKLLAALHSK